MPKVTEETGFIQMKDLHLEAASSFPSRAWYALQAFLLDGSVRRKLSVHMLGANEGQPVSRNAEAEQDAAEPMEVTPSTDEFSLNKPEAVSATAANAGSPDVQVIEDMWAWKRKQALFPSL